MGVLYLLRHGQSTWNLEDRFTGWADVPLTDEGKQEMVRAATKLQNERVALDAVYTSALSRTVDSARIVLQTLAEQTVPTTAAPELNERFYGELQGKGKQEAARTVGTKQVHLWRRSYAVAPPGGESLKAAAERILPYFERAILPKITAAQTVLVCSHGNTIRAIRMKLDRLTENEIVDMEVPTGGLYRYAFNRVGVVVGFRIL